MVKTIRNGPEKYDTIKTAKYNNRILRYFNTICPSVLCKVAHPPFQNAEEAWIGSRQRGSKPNNPKSGWIELSFTKNSDIFARTVSSSAHFSVILVTYLDWS